MWMLTVSTLAALAALHVHGRANLLAIARAIAASADLDGGVIAWPGDAYLAARTELCERTVRRWRRWLAGRGLLVTTVPGSTPRFRPGVVDDGQGNLRNAYLLCVPALPGTQGVSAQVSEGGEKSVRPTWFPVGKTGRGSAPTRARAEPFHRGADDSGPARRWSTTANPRTQGEMLAACQRLRAESVTLRRISARWLRAVLRPAFVAGATPRDVLCALDRRPDGTSWKFTDRVRYVPGWLRHRLTAWQAAGGGFAAWPSQRDDAERAKLREAQRERREVDEARRAGRGDQAAGKRACLDALQAAQQRAGCYRGTASVSPSSHSSVCSTPAAYS